MPTYRVIPAAGLWIVAQDTRTICEVEDELLADRIAKGLKLMDLADAAFTRSQPREEVAA